MTLKSAFAAAISMAFAIGMTAASFAQSALVGYERFDSFVAGTGPNYGASDASFGSVSFDELFPGPSNFGVSNDGYGDDPAAAATFNAITEVSGAAFISAGPNYTNDRYGLSFVFKLDTTAAPPADANNQDSVDLLNLLVVHNFGSVTTPSLGLNQGLGITIDDCDYYGNCASADPDMFVGYRYDLLLPAGGTGNYNNTFLFDATPTQMNQDGTIWNMVFVTLNRAGNLLSVWLNPLTNADAATATRTTMRWPSVDGAVGVAIGAHTFGHGVTNDWNVKLDSIKLWSANGDTDAQLYAAMFNSYLSPAGISEWSAID